jgi:hypothetical protein
MSDNSWRDVTAEDFRDRGPVETLKDALLHLRRPFEPAAVRWKVQRAGQGWGVVVAYIDSRLVIERLNLVVGGAWHDEYRPWGAGHEECALTVFGVTRRDVGQGTGPQAVKAARSDARKRAGVLFGIGVSIYALAGPRLSATPGDDALPGRPLVRNRQGQKGGWSATISTEGEEWLAEKYADWLGQRGQKLFGPPLEHGDEHGAAGMEADEVASDQVEKSEPVTVQQVQGEEADGLRAAATEHYQAIRGMNAAQIPPKKHRLELEQAGGSIETLRAYVEELAEVRVNMEEARK